jgi:glycosyltransferase involved in cell wall biosynthesis
VEKKLAIITTHPIQYQVPLFKELNKIKNLKLYVFYASDHGVNSKGIDKEFNKRFAWDIPMLDGYKFFFSKKNYNYNSWFLKYTGLSQQLKNIEADFILIFGWNKLLYLQAFFYAIFNNVPILLRAENNLGSNNSLLKNAIKKILFPKFFNFFYKIFYIGKLNKYFYMHYGVKKNKLLFSPYFVDNDFFKKKHAINNNVLNVLYVGKFISRKRPFDILKTALILKDYKHIQFFLAGDGPLLQECKNWVKKKRLNNTNFLGFKNQFEIKKIYNKSHILVNSSAYETWALVVNEAMAAGLPCIVTNMTGCSVDLVKNNQTGYVYKLGDLKSLSKLILKFYLNKKNLRKMSLGAKNLIKKYSTKTNSEVISKTIFST